MIEVQNLSKSFKTNSSKRKKLLNSQWKTVYAVNDISFLCKPGRILTLVGPNGAGKTTTLRILATILKPSQGKVLVNGHDVTRDELEVRRSIGFLTGSTGLYGRLTPNELMSYFGKLYGMSNADVQSRKTELYDQLGIHEFAHRRIEELSTGMKQKVSVCRTILHNPDVVIFDEPTAGLDVITIQGIIELIKACKEQNKTVIFSTHNMSEVELLCDDIAVINNGKILYNDMFDNLKKQMKTNSLTEEFISIINKEN